MWLTRAMSIKLLGQLHQVVEVNLLREQPGLGAGNGERVAKGRYWQSQRKDDASLMWHIPRCAGFY